MHSIRRLVQVGRHLTGYQTVLSSTNNGPAGSPIAPITQQREYHDFGRTTRKVCCIGRNYVDHIKELNNTPSSEPFFFLKPPSSIVQPAKPSPLPTYGTRETVLSAQTEEAAIERGNRCTLELPEGIESHHEAELGIVISQTLRDLPAPTLKLPASADEADFQAYLAEPSVKKAFASIAGYTTAIDMTARNLQQVNKATGLPWTTAKGFDTYLPCSHFLPKDTPVRSLGLATAGMATGATLHDAVQRGRITLWLGVYPSTSSTSSDPSSSEAAEGKAVVRQHDDTALMIYDVPKILSHISQIMTLHPGDVVLTGTPKGVSRVHHGDTMVAEMRIHAPSGEVEIVAGSRVAVDCRDRAPGGYVFRG